MVLEVQCLASLSLQEKAIQTLVNLQSVLLLCTSKLIVVKLVTILGLR